jgi:chromosome segregation ATPase
MNKSLSESNLNDSSTDQTSPPNFVFGRAKKRKELLDGERSITSTGDNDLSTFREEMREMFASLLAAQRQEFNKINPTLKTIQETNAKIECSIEFLSNQNAELQKRVEKLELQKKEDAKYIITLEDKIENMQKSYRKTNFEIKNVPKKEKETKEELKKNDYLVIIYRWLKYSKV